MGLEMNAFTKVYAGDAEAPALEMIETPWGFRLRPADMQDQATDAVIEWGLTFLGIVLIASAFGQWVLPGALYGSETLVMKLVLTVVLAAIGGLVLSISARGFRPEVQVDRSRHEIRFVSRNPRGRGKILAMVDLDRIIGVGMTRSIDGPDCHCLLYLIDGEKPLRMASGTEVEIKKIRKRMDEFVTSPADRVAAKAEKAGKSDTEEAVAGAA